MKPINIIAIGLFLCCSDFFSQNKNLVSIASSFTSNGNWIKFRLEARLSPASVMYEHKSAFGLSADDDVELERVENDELGMTHYRYRQLYRSIPVEGGQYFIHAKNGFAVKGNGKLVKGINTKTEPAITSTDALKNAMDYLKAKHYFWEDKGTEQILKMLKQDSSASFYPHPQMVIAQADIAREDNYLLAYKVDIYASEPFLGKTVYVDAVSGRVLYTFELIQTGDVIATVVTKYSGIQTIITDSVSPNLYRLRESGRAGGIETYNMQKKVSYGTAVDFTDNNNYWDTINSSQDEAATDAHWATEKTYDYYLQTHNRNSFDNKGSKMLSYVHFSAGYINAFWNGFWMTYGDGNGTTYKALTPLDVSGHEMTHGVTQFSAGLVYLNESGALNESFSDIFGTCIEFFGKPSVANWLVAEDIGTPFRSMSNPKSKGDPDTYKGLNYYIGSQDFGGVHTNSGVQNYWFYLLTIGDTGTNDKGHHYNVSGIGIDKAAMIAYRNLTVYTIKKAQFIDSRQGSIWAAEDLYGVCSNEVLQTSNAWYAVGLGYPVSDQDVGLLKVNTASTACGLTNAENVSFLLRNNGCDAIVAGDTILASYRVNSSSATIDTLVLSASMAEGDSLQYDFIKKMNLSLQGSYTISAWVTHKGDTLHFNDSIKNIQITNRFPQNIDVGIVSVISPVSACDLSGNEKVKLKWKFFGCDSLSKNEQVVLGYRIDKGAVIKETATLTSRMLPSDTVEFSFGEKANLYGKGKHIMDYWTEYAKDTILNNDSLTNILVENPLYVRDSVITFEDSASVVDSFYVVAHSGSSAYIAKSAAHTGKYGFRMTGGDWFNNRLKYKNPTDLNTWAVNDEFSAKICFCVDATPWQSADLHFDLKQTYNATFSAFINYNNPYTSNLRVLANDVQVGNTFHPKTKKQDTWVVDTVFNLDTYAGSKFTLCFQTKNYLSQPYETSNGVGDNAYLDNVYFTGVPKPPPTASQINVYPNPGKGNIKLSYVSPEDKTIDVQLIDVLGRIVWITTKSVSVGTSDLVLSTEALSSGVYTIRVQSNAVMEYKQLIIEK